METQRLTQGHFIDFVQNVMNIFILRKNFTSLCKKSRNFTKVASPLVSTVNVEISDGCSPEITQTTDHASLLTSPIDVTIKSLDPTTSVGLVDDIAYDASSSTAVGETLHNTHSIATTEDPTLNTHVSKDSPSEGSSAK